MNSPSDKWVAIVYDKHDKVGSHEFEGKEDIARVEAGEWVIKNFGENWNWSLHHIHNK